jgi:hypothetical protein
MKHTIENLDLGQLDYMWTFLRMGKQRANIPALKHYCDELRQAMIQKTAGQERYKRPYETDCKDLGTTINCLVIETMCLYLSGDLDKLEQSNEN